MKVKRIGFEKINVDTNLWSENLVCMLPWLAGRKPTHQPEQHNPK
jgi:hypothetical protein